MQATEQHKRTLADSAVAMMEQAGLQPDPWQARVLTEPRKQILLNCSRQAGKSTVVAVLALAEALLKNRAKVLLLSRSEKQSKELLAILGQIYTSLGSPCLERMCDDAITLTTGSRINALPCNPATVRGYSAINLLIIDEAARVPEEMYRSVRPMLATTNGRLICLSTPYGRRGFFYNAWARGGDDWARFSVTVDAVPRISREFLELERRSQGEAYYRQEYECSFEGMEGLVYPDLHKCIIRSQVPMGSWFGGLDYGTRSPCAAVWGVRDNDDVLWLTGEVYGPNMYLDTLAGELSKEVVWYADPAGERETKELKRAGLKIVDSINNRRMGMQAVNARIASGRLKILHNTCPNLLAEAAEYRFREREDDRGSETDTLGSDHAVDALRYLVCKLDQNFMAKRRKPGKSADAPLELIPAEYAAKGKIVPEDVKHLREAKKQRKWLSYHNEALWTVIGLVDTSGW
jgi:hypothetical protein